MPAPKATDPDIVALEEKLKKRAGEIEKQQRDAEPPDPPDPEPPDADADTDDEPDDTQEPAPRRDNRWQRMNRERDEARAAEAQMRTQLTQALTLLQESRARPDPEPSAKKDDPFDAKLALIKRERTALFHEIEAGKGRFTQEQIDNIEARAAKLEEEHVETLAERLVSRRGLAQPAQREHPLKPILALQFPDVVQNPKAVDYARAYFQMERAKGRPESVELVVESHQRAREALRTAPGPGRMPDPNAATRRTALGAGPGGGAPPDDAPVGLTKEQKKMADSLYPDEQDPKKRYDKWAKGPGARLRRKS